LGIIVLQIAKNLKYFSVSGIRHFYNSTSAHLPYKDEYVGYELDISRIIFIIGATYAPSSHSVIDGEYSLNICALHDAEKQEFWEKWLIPKSAEEVGIKSENLEIKPEALKLVLNDYIGAWNTISYQKMICDTICRWAATKGF